MRFDIAHNHMGHLHRRDALKLGAGAAAAAALSGARLPAAGAQDDAAEGDSLAPSHFPPGYSDAMFDFAAVADGGVWVSPYGPDDQRGTLNEVTPERTARALRRLHLGQGVKAYQLGEEMFNGFPAFPASPPRLHDMRLQVFGYDAGDDFEEAANLVPGDGKGIQSGVDPLGQNLVFGMEERFDQFFTFQIGTQLDGLNHVGIATGDERGGRFYNDTYAADIATPTGTTELGNETMGPIATRGVILDVIGLKVATGATGTFFQGPDGTPILNGDYRITIEDIEACLHRQRIRRHIGAGDVPIFHTGWTKLAHHEETQAQYLSAQPGIYLAEARYFIDRKVAIVASDTWGLETLNPTFTNGNAFPCHQLLLGQIGVRIGESFVTTAAVADHCYEGTLIITPENVPGATAGSSAPTLLGQPGKAPRN